MTLSLVEEPLVLVDAAGTTRSMTLPGALAAMSVGSIDGFAGLRPHQRHALHLFAVQVACMGMQACGHNVVAADEGTWRERLLAVAPAPAWHLLQDDPALPAFMQPPMGAADYGRALANVDKQVDTPDDVTVLVRAKNHSQKFARMIDAEPWHWAVALIEIQTLSGYEGFGLHGVARMNGGFGTRFMVGVYPNLLPASMFVRDVGRVLGLRSKIEAEVPAFGERPAAQKPGALWALPWDGETSLAVADLDPLFVDVSRRIRLFRKPDGRIVSTYIITKVPRVDAKAFKGVLGDPWIPLNIKNGTAAGLKTIDVRALRDFVLQDSSVYKPSMLQARAEGDPSEMTFYLAAVIGGQGKTEGFEEIAVPIPGNLKVDLFDPVGAKVLGGTADEMLKSADKAWTCLRMAIFGMAQSGKEKVSFDHPQSKTLASVASAKFRRRYGDAFFPCLWETHREGGADIWVAKLKAEASAVLEEMLESHGGRTQLSFKARAKATGIFGGLWHREFNRNEVEE